MVEILKKLCGLIGAVVILVVLAGLVYKTAQDGIANKQCIAMGFADGYAAARGIVCQNEIIFPYVNVVRD